MITSREEKKLEEKIICIIVKMTRKMINVPKVEELRYAQQ